MVRISATSDLNRLRSLETGCNRLANSRHGLGDNKLEQQPGTMGSTGYTGHEFLAMDYNLPASYLLWLNGDTFEL